MAIRRIISLQDLLIENTTESVNLSAEIVALIISALVLTGIVKIRPILKNLYAAKKNLENTNKKLNKEIEQRKIIEKEAHINEEKFKSLVEASPVLIWMSDTTANCTYFNQRWLDFRGQTLEEEKGMGWTKGLHEEDKEQTIHKFLDSFKKRKSFELEYRLRNKDHEFRWIYDIGNPMYDQNNQFMGYIGSCIDVTERREIEKALKESEEKFRTIFENSPLGIFRSTLQGKFLEVNPALAQMLGYNTPKEVIESIDDIAEQIYVKTRRRKEFLNTVHKENKVQKFENIYKRRNGTHFTANLLLNKITDSKGNIKYLEGIVEDITEQKEAEDKLKRSEQQKSLILQSMREKLLYIDTDLRIKWTNKAALEIINKKEEEIKDLYCYEIWHNKNTPCENCPALKVLKTQKTESSVIQLEERIFNIHAYPVIENEQIIGILEVGEDITEQKKAEDELKKSEKKFRMFFNENNAVKLIINPKTGAILAGNKSAKKFYGDNNLESKYIQDINQLSQQEVEQEMKRAFHREKNYFYFKHKLANGEIRHVEVHSTPLEIDENQYLYSIIHDITDRIKAEEAVKLSEQKFKKIVNTIPQFVSYVDKDLVYRFVNKTYLDRFNMKEKDIVGKKLVDIIGKQSFEKAKPRLEKVLNGERIHYKEYFKYPNKMSAHMEATLIPEFDTNGKVQGYYAILSDVTHHMINQQLLEISRNRLRGFSEHQQNILERERSYIAREIHDELGQNLTAIRMGLSMLKQQISRKERNLFSKVQELSHITQTTLAKIKKLSTELRPQLIDDMGLVAAIEWYANNFEKRSGIDCHLEIPDEETEIPKDKAIHIYRIVQEGLTNVYKHADADYVELIIRMSKNELFLELKDNGKGIKEKDSNKSNSLGIIGMEERVNLMEGEFNIQGSKVGTIIQIKIPV
jgi:PAS domain S-box-containing protein